MEDRTVEMMADLIPRDAAVRALVSSNGDYLDAWERLEKIPAIDAIPMDWLNDVIADGDERISKAAVVVKRQWEWERRMKGEAGKPV